jgi:hypothetical protein
MACGMGSWIPVGFLASAVFSGFEQPTSRLFDQSTSRPAGYSIIRLSKVQSVDMRMRLGMRCRLSPTVDLP